MEIGWAETNYNQKQPDDVDTIATVPGVLLVQNHQEGRHNEEQHVGDGINKLSNVWGEGVIVLQTEFKTNK